MSIASVVRRGYVDSVTSVTRRGYSGTASAPELIGGVGRLRLVLGRPVREFDLSAVFSGSGLSYSISPALAVDGSLNTGTGILTWNPATAGDFGPYTVRATNSSGFIDSDAFLVSVQTNAPSFALYDLGIGFKLRIGL